MSEPRDAEKPADTAPQPPEPVPPEPSSEPPRRRHAATALWLLALLLVMVAGTAASPLWAPAVAPLLPWSAHRASGSDGKVAAQLRQLQQRVDRLEGLEPRIAKLEQNAARLDRIEVAGKDAQQQRAAAADAVQKLEQRLTAVEARLATVPAGGAEQAQRLDALEKTGGDAAAAVKSLGGRVEALEKAEQQQAGADPTDTGLLLMLLQIRDAIAAGRPFAAEYDAFTALAHDRPKIAAAAAPLAADAQHAVPTRDALRQQLDALSLQIAEARPPETSGWTGQAWARMRSLVSVRRIGGSGQSPSESAVGAAQRELAQGDLAAAVGRLKALSGAAAEAAKPWLDAADTRLAAENALRRTQQLLTDRFAAQRRPGQP